VPHLDLNNRKDENSIEATRGESGNDAGSFLRKVEKTS